jgi:hypothetical protein
MKKLIAASMLLASMNVFSQSYLILNNGVTLTTDMAGLVYDFGHFALPSRVTLNGGQFLVEDKILQTIDSKGFLYSKDMKIDDVKGKGINYLINDNKLITIDAQGFFYEFDKDSRSIFRKITTFGGYFFLVKPEDRKPQIDLYTINNAGNYFKIDVQGLNPANISGVGGNYFQDLNGVIYTISKEGFVFPKPQIKAGKILKAGGNFFIDSSNTIYTISEAGILILPSLPANLKLAQVLRLGVNYMIDSAGKIFTVDSAGSIHERSANHNLLNARVLSL